MKRILGIFAASSLLLTACGGGGLQSPNFTPVLAGVFIASPAESTPATSASSPLLVVPGGTLQLVARGLYSTPPGTSPNAAGVIACDDPATTASEVCTLGEVSGVTFSIDPSTTTDNRPRASISSAGLVSGLRRGSATVRARLVGFDDSSRALTVNGPVLTSIAVTALDVKNNQTLSARPASVPTGRVIALTGVATCSTGGPGTGAPLTTSQSACTNQNYNFSWNLPAATPVETASFIPSSAQGETIAVRTQRFGPFGIEVSLANEEGDPIESSINLEATARVLDDVIVVADPVQAEPVPIIKGTRVRFVAKGVFSDGTTEDLIEADLTDRRTANAGSTYRAGRRLTWRQDTSAVGGPVLIEDPADRTSASQPNGLFNNSVIVSVMEPSTLGVSGITATGFNIEQIPVSGSTSGATEPLLVEDRAAIRVDDLGLTAITRICLASDVGSACTVNTQVQEGGDPVKYVARGIFQGDVAGTERNIDPALIPIQFTTTTPTLLTVNVDGDGDGKDGNPATLDPDATIDFDDVGAVRGATQGLARLIATLPNGFAPTISDRDEAIDIAVTELSCRDQFLTGNGATASSDNGDLIGISNVTDEGSVIDGLRDTYGTFTAGSSVLGGTLSMTFLRPGTPLLTAGGTQNVGFTLNDQDGYVSSSTVSIRTLDAAGATVETFNNVTPSSNLLTGDAQRTLIQAPATLPFSGVSLSVDIPPLLGIPGTVLDLPALTLLFGYEVRVYSACGQVVSQ